jgi:predicted dehydrogenase
MRTINAGIIGTGFVGPMHVEAVRRLGFAEMAALAEVDAKTARAKGDQLSIAVTYGDYRELLANPQIEIVHICTPNTSHYPMAKEAIAAGKAVIVEKPLAMSSRESRELTELARKANIAAAVDFNYRFYPLNQHARAMVAKGEVGDIYVVHGSYLQDWLYLPTDYNWRVEPDQGGASRAVADVGSHWCDLMQFIIGRKITTVYADLDVVHRTRMKPKRAVDTYAGKELKPEDYEPAPITTEDYGTVLMRFGGGARGALTVCQVAAGRKNRLYYEIDGSKCALAYDQEDPERLWIGHRERANEILMRDPSLLAPEARKYMHTPGGHPEGYPDGLKNFVRNFYAYHAEGKRPATHPPDFPTFEDGHNEIAMVEAVLESHKRKQWVDVKY